MHISTVCLCIVFSDLEKIAKHDSSVGSKIWYVSIHRKPREVQYDGHLYDNANLIQSNIFQNSQWRISNSHEILSPETSTLHDDFLFNFDDVFEFSLHFHVFSMYITKNPCMHFVIVYATD